ncbi:MAG TPA: SDR family oxidoreductase [Xanthobacteraceae bacterium]|nr:SDR family oxidoreductase [Xanthobacteraceae bacterium]
MARLSRNLPQSTVVITGASAGVGRATALRFARAGANLALIARDRAALEDVRGEVERLGGTAMVMPLDVADADAVLAAADAIAAERGGIDIWINDAMVTVFGPVWQLTPDEFRRVTEVTYLGFVHGTMAALRHMRPRNRGTIVQVGSALAYRGIPLQAAYCGAKYAIRGFTDSLRSELIHADSKVALTIVELPAVNTPQFDWARTHMPREPRPVAPVVQPEAIAEIIFRAALDPKREYWLGLSTLKAILGGMVLPAFLDRYLAKNAYDAQETKSLVSPAREDNLMTPVAALHRTRGRFGNEAANSVVAVPGPLARLIPVVAGGIVGLSLGLALGALPHRQANCALPRRPFSLLR